jgi:SAM-dependent methyltransferase
MGFEATWLAARRPYDEAALDRGAVAAIQTWAARLPRTRPVIVVDLGSGTGVALNRAAAWLAPHDLRAYAVDADSGLISLRVSAGGASSGATDHPATVVTPLVGDLLTPLEQIGGPAAGAVDLVLGHAVADLLPLDRLAERVAALLRPGGLAHLALTYDGLTAFSAEDGTGRRTADLDNRVIGAFHQRMDRPREADPSYGGSTAGRRLPAALAGAGLEIVRDGPSAWLVRATDGPDGRAVLDRLLQYVAEAARDTSTLSEQQLQSWERQRRGQLAAGMLTARVGHRDVLAHKPASATPDHER